MQQHQPPSWQPERLHGTTLQPTHHHIKLNIDGVVEPEKLSRNDLVSNGDDEQIDVEQHPVAMRQWNNVVTRHNEAEKSVA